ncbi:MAG: hypothetical protein IRZ03_16215 [Acidobacterium ailaaui]|nr:hypothetical protein [Pseudacidobacterium ailaaui]
MPAYPTREDLEKLAQLRESVLHEAANSSPYMAALWESIHAQVARAHIRAQKALARAERSAVIQATKAARQQKNLQASPSEEQDAEG